MAAAQTEWTLFGSSPLDKLPRFPNSFIINNSLVTNNSLASYE